jgi:hypothetical protein
MSIEKPQSIDELKSFQISIETLRRIVVVITGDREYSVKRDDGASTAFVDLQGKKIVLTAQLIPRGLPQWKQERLMEAEAIHEGSHPIVTGPYEARYQAWERSKLYPSLARTLSSIFEDLRTNWYGVNRYPHDFGPRLKGLLDTTAESISEATMKQDLDKFRLEKALNALATLVIYDRDVVDCLDTEARQIVRDSAHLMFSSQFNKSGRDLIAALEKSYQLFESLTIKPSNSRKPKQSLMDKLKQALGQGQNPPKPSKSGEKKSDGQGESAGEGEPSPSEAEGEGGQKQKSAKGKPTGAGEEDTEPWDGGDLKQYRRDVDKKEIPNTIGGEKRLDATGEAKAEAEAELKQLEDKLKKELEKVASQAKMSRGGTASGVSTGAEIPAPEPNEEYYHQLVRDNSRRIMRLVNMSKTGRYMAELHTVFKLYSRGGAPFENMFEGTKMGLDKSKVKVAGIFDLSGSMDTRAAQDCLTTIAEACGNWIPSEDFALMVFGDNFAKVKTFIEPYHAARYRIGGVRCMGCTTMAPALNSLIKLIATYRRTDFNLILLVFSDFQPTDDCGESIRLIAEAERMGIKVVGVGLCYSDLERVQRFVKPERATFVSDVNMIPDLFFKVYRQAAMLHV